MQSAYALSGMRSAYAAKLRDFYARIGAPISPVIAERANL
jgi:hypothetical protein